MSDLKVLSIGLSDHLLIKLILNKIVNQLPINRKESSKVLRANWIQEQIQEFSSGMATNSEWIVENYKEINDLNSCTEALIQRIMWIAKETDLMKEQYTKKNINAHRKPWFDKARTSMRKELIYKRKMWSKTKDENSRAEYTEYREKYIDHVKKTKKEHYITIKNVLENIQNAYTICS